MGGMHKNHEAVQLEVATHLKVFWLILVVVALNVAMTFLPVDRVLRTTVQVALAVLGAGLVLTFYMHLLSETVTTYLVVGLTGFLCLALLALTLVARDSVPEGTHSTINPGSPVATPELHVP